MTRSRYKYFSRIPLTPAHWTSTIYLPPLLAECADLAYRIPEQQVFYLRQAGFEAQPFATPYDTEGFIAVRPECVIVCFRGTEVRQIADARTDIEVFLDWLDLAPRIVPQTVRAHRGVMRAVGEWFPLYQDYVTRFDDRSLFVVGHSLGGALAQVTAARIAAISSIQPVCYTYGSMKAGNREFGDWATELGVTHYRYVFETDPVPDQPIWPQGYQHFGELRYISTRGEVLSHRPLTDKLRSFWRWMTRQDGRQLGADWLNDHKRLDAYANALWHHALR